MDVKILNEEQLALLLSILRTAREVVVVGHKNPDGDSLGSCLAWAQVMRECYGVSATVVVPDSYPDYLMWLPESHCVVNYERKSEQVDELLRRADYVFCLDFNELNRTGGMEEALRRSDAKKVMFDHHLNPDMDAVLAISNAAMCSTCELLYHLVRQMGHYEKMTSKWASMIYCGMTTDTGCFTYNASRPEIYSTICELMAKGIDKEKIYRNVYHNYSSWAVRFRGYIMAQKLNVFDDLHASYFAISKGEMAEYHFVKGDAEGLVNVPLTIKDMRLSISLREDDRKENTVWVSIRSVDDVAANEMAERFFHGGGHKNAAGGHLDCSLDEAVAITKEAIKAFAEQLKK